MTPEELEAMRQDPKNWGFIGLYNCADDPRIIVPKRVKWTGYTINFAHSAGIPVLLAILLAIGAPFGLALVMEPEKAFVWVTVAFSAVIVATIAICHWESTRPR